MSTFLERLATPRTGPNPPNRANGTGDDRGAAHRHARADPGQRFLRRRRVLAGPGTPLSPGTDRRRRCPSAARACTDRRNQRVPLSLPARSHLRLDRDRVPRRASHRGAHPPLARRLALTRARARDQPHDRLRADDSAAHHDRRAGPKAVRDLPRGSDGPEGSPPPVLVYERSSALRRRAQRRFQRDPAAASCQSFRRVGGGRHAGGLEAVDRPIARGRTARRRRSADARRRLRTPRATRAPG